MSAGSGLSRSNSRSGIVKNRRVLSRSGRKSRQSQLTSSANKARESAFGTGSPVSDSEFRGTLSADLIDFSGTDIYNEDGWDTDLEEETVEDKAKPSEDPSYSVYLGACKANGVIPASYFLRHCQDSSLDMRHHGLGPAGVKPLAVALAASTSVIQLNLMDNWLDHEGGEYVGDMLKENCYITHVDLSENRLGAPFAEQFISILASNSTLTHVNLAGNLFDEKAAAFLAEALMSTTKLEYLNLSKNRFGEKAGVLLGSAIAENSSLRTLDLSWNCFRLGGAVALAKGLKQNVLLQTLNLSWNGLALEGAKALCDALKVNCSLEQLDISNNRFTTEAAVLFSKALVVNETLKVLKMGKNPMQSAGCYGVCASVLRNPNSVLRQLDFSNIEVNNDFIDLQQKVKAQFPDLRIHHGGDGIPLKPRAVLPPISRLCNFIERHNIRLVDIFQSVDPDRKMRVSRSQFVEGTKNIGIKLQDFELEQIMDDLDPNGSGEVNYNELILGRTEFDNKISNRATATDSDTINESEKVWRK